MELSGAEVPDRGPGGAGEEGILSGSKPEISSPEQAHLPGFGAKCLQEAGRYWFPSGLRA